MISAMDHSFEQSPAVSWIEPAELKKMQTPCYVFNPDRVITDYGSLKRALGTPLVVSLKANPNPDLFARCANAFVDGIEVASVGELNVVVGRSAIPKFINTPAMDSQLMAAGIASRATLIMESLAQVSTLESILSRIRPLPVVLRLNAAGLAGELAAAPGGDHFGLDVQDALTAVARLRALGIPVRGLHVFAGSYSFKNSSPRILEAMQRLLPSVELAAGTPLQFVNLGGGFPHDWQDHTPWFDDYRRAMAPLSQRIQLYHESGRAVFANGGSFVTKIVAVKTINGRRVAICDGGMAHCFMLAQTEKVLKRFQHPLVVSMHEGAAGSVQGRVQIVGNSCNRMDVIGELDCGVAVDVGDRLVFAGCGSYSTYSPTGFLSLKAAVRYLIS